MAPHTLTRMTMDVEPRPPRTAADLFRLDGATALVTGGTGVLGGESAVALAAAGARVAVLGRDAARAEQVRRRIKETGGHALVLLADVRNPGQLQAAREKLEDTWGALDILINAAGGHVPGAITSPEQAFADLPQEALRGVVDLNLLGTVLPTQVFASMLTALGGGPATASVINFSSMTASRAVSRVLGYGAAKAAVENFTRWLAQDLARAPRPVRVNAIAPGFFVADTNRSLLVDGDVPTSRGRQILDRTPMGRFGLPHELVGTVVYLAGAASGFVTGTVIAVDGGFSSWSGV